MQQKAVAAKGEDEAGEMMDDLKSLIVKDWDIAATEEPELLLTTPEVQADPELTGAPLQRPKAPTPFPAAARVRRTPEKPASDDATPQLAKLGDGLPQEQR